MKTPHSKIELLEPRIAPAALITAGGKTATFTDSDGDLVTVHVTKGALKMTDFNLMAAGVGEACMGLDLTGVDGANVSITARPGPLGGDGRVYVDNIHADVLGAVSVAGDVRAFSIGTAGSTAKVLGSLRVESVASFGGVGFYEIQGNAGSISVQRSVFDGSITVMGKLGALRIGGDLHGAVEVTGTAGNIFVGGDLHGNAANSGRIAVDSVRSITIGGSLVGGIGADSGTVKVLNSAGAFHPRDVVSIGGDLRGGVGMNSGVAEGSFEVLRIRGSVVGGNGYGSGAVVGNTISTSISGDIEGGRGSFSGRFGATAFRLSVGGSVIGGTLAADVTDDLTNSGVIDSNNVTNLFIGGSVIGGTDLSATKTLSVSGGLNLGADVHSVVVKGSILGGSRPAFLYCYDLPQSPGAGLGSLSVGGDVIGGDIRVGTIFVAQMLVNAGPDQTVGRVTVGGDFLYSDLSAGVDPGADKEFGTNDDALFAGGDPAKLASIAQVIIRGRVASAGAIHHGIVAERIGAATIGKGRLALTSGIDVIQTGASLPGLPALFSVREDV